MEKKTKKKPGVAVNESDKQVLRRQVKILFVILGALALGWAVWHVGDDLGWGSPKRAFDTKLARAQQAIVERKTDAAVALFKACVTRYPDNPQVEQAYTGLAAAYEELGDLDAAIKVDQELLGKAGNADLKAYTQLQIGKLYASKKDVKASQESYLKVLSEFPKSDWSGESLSGLGRLYQEQRDFKQAMGYFQRVIKEYPKGFLAAEAQGALGECLEAQGKTKQALKAYQVVLDEYPSAVWDQAKLRIQALQARLREETVRKTEE